VPRPAAPNTYTTTAAANLIQEGVTPPAESITILDTTVQVQKYGALYGYTERQESLGEDDVPELDGRAIGRAPGPRARAGLHRRRAGQHEPLLQRRHHACHGVAAGDLNLVNRVTRSLANNHAVFMRGVLAPSANYGTSSIQKAYLAFGTPTCSRTSRPSPATPAVKDYGSMKPAHEMEIGAVGSVRFILSPDMPKVIDAGAAIAGTTNLSTTGTLADVYQLFVMAKDAWGHTAFRGLDAFKYNHIPVSKADKSDPTGERGYVSATFYDAGVVTNHGWMALCEVAISALT
jgi:hypothetical protein